MAASLRRAYFYLICSGALIFTAVALQGFIHQVALRLGVVDYTPNYCTTPDLSPCTAPAGAFTQALTLLIVALVLVVPVGALHYWFMRRDAKSDPQALGGVVRAVFLDLLTIGIGLTFIIALFRVVDTAFASANTVNGYYVSVNPNQASNVSAAIAFGLATLALLVERRWTSDQIAPARHTSWILLGLTQLGLLITALVYGAQAVQSVVEALVQSPPACPSGFTGPPSFPQPQSLCHYVDWTVGSAVGRELVLVAGLAGFTWLARSGARSAIGQVFAMLYLVAASITAVIGLSGGIKFALDLSSGAATFPNSLLSLGGYSGTPLDFGPNLFLGPLVIGLIAVGWYASQAWQRQAGGDTRRSSQFALVAMAAVLIVTFMVSAAETLDVLFQHIAGETVVLVDQWHSDLAGAIAGLPWIALWAWLARSSDVRAVGPTAPRRLFVLFTLGVSLLATVIGLAVTLYERLTGLVGAGADPTGDTTRTALGVTLAAGAVAAYFASVQLSDQRALARRPAITPTPVEAPAAGAPPTSLTFHTVAEVVRAAIAGQLDDAEAATILRAQFGARDDGAPSR